MNITIDQIKDLKRVCNNMLQILQTNPIEYKNFGIYWWPVKRLLRKFHTQDELYMLGSYIDPDATNRIPPTPWETLIKDALAEYRNNKTFTPGQSYVDPQGEVYHLHDQDAGF